MPGASGIEVVWAAMMAPVSSKLQSFRVMAARMMSAWYSSGTASERTQSSQYCRVRSRNSREAVSTAASNGSSGPSMRVTGLTSANGVSCAI